MVGFALHGGEEEAHAGFPRKAFRSSGINVSTELFAKSTMRRAEGIPVLVTLASVFMLIVPGLARPEPQSQLDTFVPPWIWPPIPHLETQNCWSSLPDISGCWQEILNSCFTLQITLGPKCCNVINQLNENCVDKLFPEGFSNPFLPLVERCAPNGDADAPAQADHSQPAPDKQPSPPTEVDAQSPKGGDAEKPDQEIAPSPNEEGPEPDQGDAQEPDVAPSPSEKNAGNPDSSGDGQEPDVAPSPGEENAGISSSPGDAQERDVAPSPSEKNAGNPDSSGDGQEPDVAPSPGEENAGISGSPGDAQEPDVAPSPSEKNAGNPDSSGDGQEPDVAPSPGEENAGISDTPGDAQEPDVAPSPGEENAGISDPPEAADALTPAQGPFAGEADVPTSDELDTPSSQ